MNHKPIQISKSEWDEIAQVPVVRDGWGLSDHETPEEFAAMVFGAKFQFVSGSPGYCGDLFVLLGDALTDAPPLILIRVDGKLTAAV